MKLGSLASRYRWLLSVAGFSLLAAGTWWMLASGDKGTTYAVVFTFTVAVLTLLVAAYGTLWQAGSPDQVKLITAIRKLAREVATREAEQQQRLLADTGQARPADIGFMQSELVNWRTDGGGRLGFLKDIEGFYNELRRGRLLVLGDAGAGKTVLVNQLLLDLITVLPATDPAPGGRLAMPVRMSLASFNPGTPPRTPSEVSAAIDNWIAQYLTDVYGLALRIARTLVRQSWIIPVLDGLDEMDLDGGDPARAAAVMRALNYPVGPAPRPVIVTCRTSRYDQLVEREASSGERSILQDATAIHIVPLTPDQISAYLTHHFPNPVDSADVQDRWQPVLSRITSQPSSDLATVLSSPLFLFLAITAYYEPNAAPAELNGMSADVLADHLLDKFLPACTSLHPRSGGSTYDAQHVTNWLTTLANYLSSQQARGNSGTDIDLHTLWTAVGYRAPRYIAAILAAVFTAIPVFGLVNWYARTAIHLGRPAMYSVIAALVGTFVVAAVFWDERNERVNLRRIGLPRYRNRIVLLRIVIAGIAASTIACGIAITTFFATFGFKYAPSSGLNEAAAKSSGLKVALIAGIAAWFALNLVMLIDQWPETVRQPGQLVSQGVAYEIATLLILVLVGGVAGIIAGGLWVGLAAGLVVAMFWLSGSPWLRYLVAISVLAYRRDLPFRTARFLDWAYSAGLLRFSGISLQFRHQQLQKHLAEPTWLKWTPPYS